jgi:glycogen debranching enzyme
MLTAKKERVSALLNHTNLLINDRDIDRAFYWTKVNLSMMDLYVPTDTYYRYGVDQDQNTEPLHGIVAGMPWYTNWFSNDGCYTILGLLSVGQHAAARSHLRLIGSASRYVNGNGRILHEVSQSGMNVGLGNIQETPQYIHTLWEYARWTGDLELVSEFYDYCKMGLFDFLLGDRNKDGDELPQGPGISEVPDLDGKVIDTAVHTCLAAKAVAEMADQFGEEEIARKAENIYERLKQKIRTKFWIEEIGEFGDNIATADRWVDVLPRMIKRGQLQPGLDLQPLIDQYEKAKKTDPEEEITGQYGKIWVASVLSSGIATQDQASKQVQVFEDRFAGPWGILGTWRNPWHSMTISTSEYLNAILNYGYPDKAVPWLQKMAFALSLRMPGAITEGSPNYGNIMQSWTTYGMHYAVVNKMVGIHPDAIKKIITIEPQIPSAWKPEFGAKRIKIANIMLDVIHEYKNGMWQTSIATDAKGWTIIYKSPLGQDKISLLINDRKLTGEKMIEVSI